LMSILYKPFLSLPDEVIQNTILIYRMTRTCIHFFLPRFYCSILISLEKMILILDSAQLITQNI
jgi:hypothetical protein